MENVTKSSYYSYATATLANSIKKRYFSCHRSGVFTSTASGSKVMKSQGTCQIGACCPSIIEVEESEKINVTFYKTHAGHENELKYLTLSKSVKSDLAKKISDGISLKQCLNDVRSSLTDTFERIHLLTRHDLRNIGNANSVFKSERRHESDPVSVELFVEEMRKLQENSPVLFYKKQGTASDTLNVNDFCLILMCPMQKEMLLKFGRNKICVDSTHGLNDYDFHLTTVMVVDKFGAGFPSAFCISNRTDTYLMELFFSAIKDKTSAINTDIFMSDDASAYYNAWRRVMGDVEKRLLCTWHVDKNWRQTLSKIAPKEKKISVYKYARTLMEQTDSERFIVLLESFLKELDEDKDTKAFGEYFRNYYSGRPEVWAYCYRVNTGINTNMFLEALHKVIKHVYMEGRKCKRLDTCIAHLLQIVKDKTWERCIKMIKGANSTKISTIHSRHRNSLTFSQEDFEQIDNSSWKVKSESCRETFYVVKREENNCDDCKLLCSYCNICIHSFSCTCIDFIVRANMCKHIHAVGITLNDISTHTQKQESHIIKEFLESTDFQNTINLENKLNHEDDDQLKSKLMYAFNSLDGKAFSDETRKQLHKCIDLFINLVDNGQKNDKIVNNEPANKKIKLQPRFYSTKKKRLNSALSISKPTVSYKSSLTESVLKKQEVINIHDTNDHSYSKNS